MSLLGSERTTAAAIVDLLEKQGVDRLLLCDETVKRAIAIVLDEFRKENIDITNPNHQQHPQFQNVLITSTAAIASMSGCERPFCVPCRTEQVVDNVDPTSHVCMIAGNSRSEAIAWLSRTLNAVSDKNGENSRLAENSMIVMSLMLARSVLLEDIAKQANDLVEENQKLRDTIEMLLNAETGDTP